MPSTKGGKNSIRSGGLRRPGQKLRSRPNVRTRNTFLSTLTLLDIERTEPSALEALMRNKLNPDTALLERRFCDVFIAARRLKSLLGAEQFIADRYLKTEEIRTSPESSAEGESMMVFPFELRPGELRKRLKFLEHLREIAECEFCIPAEYEKPITQAFGADVWKALNDWKPMNPTVIKGVEVLMEKSRILKMKLPWELPTAEQETRYLTADSLSRKQMIVKLLDIERQILQLALHNVRHVEGRESRSDDLGRLALLARYSTAARRDFDRALDKYEKEKKKT